MVSHAFREMARPSTSNTSTTNRTITTPAHAAEKNDVYLEFMSARIMMYFERCGRGVSWDEIEVRFIMGPFRVSTSFNNFCSPPWLRNRSRQMFENRASHIKTLSGKEVMWGLVARFVSCCWFITMLDAVLCVLSG